MNETIERMRKLVNENLVMGLRFQMNGELNKLESEIEQELNSRAERIDQLESLVRDMWREMATCPDYATPPCMTRNICEQIRNLGIEVIK